ncbi:membrane dipeptidase [Sphingomonas sabuli]|uniref:Membrane dipeptidase n=1 Tax=Sphingomonas sabuli TaxID=2764186 RepID=A0A7G9L111_9SPHN|nr:membrane dipeptidase [Sphingomonas sabuli]QNM82310.1 membrane dipeptidase [Sphingomonas sabuli]
MLIDRRTVMTGAVAAMAAAPLAARARPAASASWFDRAIIIDGLGGIGDPYDGSDATRLSDRSWQETLQTGVTAARDTVMPVGNVADPWGDYQKDVETKRGYFNANPDRLIHVRSAADILKAKREKKFALILGTQDTAMIGGELDRLAQLKKDGVLTVQLTYNNGNLAGDGALEPRDGGVTKLGKATIERIEAEKLLLDLSHGGARTMAEATALAKRPLVISHTGARSLTEHPRNTADATMKAVADKGGVVGVYWMPFLAAGRPATEADLIAHIERVANVVGEDHVGIGTDNGVLPLALNAEAKKKMDDWSRERAARGIASPGEGVGIYPFIEELNRIDRYRSVAATLHKRGWSVSRLEKLFGSNFLRVYREVWGG